MAIAALAGALVMLGIFWSAVLVAVQQVSSGYARELAPIFLRRHAKWPNIILAVLTAVLGALALPSVVIVSSTFTQILALAILMISITFGSIEVFRMLVHLAKGHELVLWLTNQKNEVALPALQQTYLNAANRSDRPITEAVFKVVRSHDTQLQKVFLESLIDHRELLKNDWLMRQLLDALLKNSLNELHYAVRPVKYGEPKILSISALLHGNDEKDLSARTVLTDKNVTSPQNEVTPILPEDPNDPVIQAAEIQNQFVRDFTALLRAVLVDALDIEAFNRAKHAVRTISHALAQTNPWTNAHGDLLYAIGYPLWNIGIPSAPIARTSRLAGELDEVRATYSLGTRMIWDYLCKLKNTKSIEIFVSQFAKLIGEVWHDGFDMLNPRVADIMEDGFRAQVLTSQAIQELANGLGWARRVAPEDRELQEDIDDDVITLAAMLKEIGEDDDVIRRTMSNGRIHVREHLGRVIERSWLKSESYRSVEKLLGRRILDSR